MKKYIFIILIIAVLAISACDNEQGPANEETYLGGTQGVVFDFAAGAPPATVSDSGGGQTFDIILDMNNEGEEFVDKNDMRVSIIGFPPDSFKKTIADLNDVNPDDDLEQRRKNPDGSIIEPPLVQTVFEQFEYKYPEPGNRAFPVIAEVCYKYKTHVATDLCVKEDLTSTDTDDLCQTTSPRSASTSGAPVQVTQIKQSPAGRDKTRFTFTISNVGMGKIFKHEVADDLHCARNVNSIENKIEVVIQNLVSRGAESISCVGMQDTTTTGNGDISGFVSMQEGVPRDVSCTVVLPEVRSDRIQPFNIELVYDYFEDKRTAIIVEYTPAD